MSDRLYFARAFHRAGWCPLPYDRGEKGPRAPGWPDLRYTADELAEHFGGDGNIGVLTGEPSGWLVDVDLDTPEAVALADEFLPVTLSWGRPSKERSHRLFRSPGTVYHKWEDRTGDKTATVLELRGTGHQTMSPGSTHPSGEAVAFSEDRDAVELADAPVLIEADDLLRRTSALAAAALVARHADMDRALAFARGEWPSGLPDAVEALLRDWLGVEEERRSGSNCHDVVTISGPSWIDALNARGPLEVARALGLTVGGRKGTLKRCPACGMERRSDSDRRHAVGTFTARTSGVGLWTHGKCGVTGDAVALASWALIGKARPTTGREWFEVHARLSEKGLVP